MNTNTEILTKAYDAGVTEEWERLESVSGKIEFETIKHYLNLYAIENSVVYDIGCGPGRYAEYLLEKNCRVAAIDLSQKSLDAFRYRINGHYSKNFIFSSRCCATKLDWIAPESADMILLMGPMYHLIDEKERNMALRHCWRTLKEYGFLFTVFMNTLHDEPCSCLPDYQLTTVWFQGYEVEQFRCSPHYATEMLEYHGLTTNKIIVLDYFAPSLFSERQGKSKPDFSFGNNPTKNCDQFLIISQKPSFKTQ